MKLFTLTGASGITHPEYGEFTVDDDGGVELPDEVSDHLHAVHINGKRAWETEAERHNRLVAEEYERRSDPASVYDMLAKIAAQQTPPPEPAPVKRGPGRPRSTT